MAAPLYSPDMTVAEALKPSNADVSGVFIARRTACVGCYLASFCTLEDVVKNYEIPLNEFLGELEEAAQIDHPTLTGAQNG